ncbi:putative phosphodiesterase [Spirosoma oryzae]|uniref:Putative phosphodiesterase n=1 Tax=Spirosoma oryzae TaxID=1469603 RepID=A0A2T0SNP9_9BACT|nr:metallophosphoesterase [Spirosoma oryzae]PRY35025.1 putative phosphodiesterase [Spirosoma oryzae]
MRLAFISDIHANLPALEAVLADLDRQKPDAVYCLGDLVSYAPWPNEVVQLIRQHRIPTLMGNHDFTLSQLREGEALPTVPPDPKMGRSVVTAGAQSLAFTHGLLGNQERGFLGSLPRHIRLEFDTADGRSDVLMVHGSPGSLNEYLLEDRTEADILSVMDQAGADILLFGHSHLPYHRQLPGRSPDKPAYRHAINTGSVGKPKDGDPRAGYVLIDWIGGEPRVTLIRVAYDVERAARAIEESPLPDEFADRLRRAY